MRKILLLSMALLALFSLRLEAQEAATESLFNPGDVWTYNMYSQQVEGLQRPYSIREMEQRFDGTVERDGHTYWRFSCEYNPKEPYSTPVYFLLREERGNYYAGMEYEDETGKSVSIGESCMYGFDLKPGETFAAPVLIVEDTPTLAAGIFGFSGCRFEVKRNLVIEGRKALEVKCLGSGEDMLGVDIDGIYIVEGLGFLNYGNVAMMIYFPATSGWRIGPLAELSEVMAGDGTPVYVNSMEEEAGFMKERDYTWVYGVYDRKGKVTYAKCAFNGFHGTIGDALEGRPVYRRFGKLYVSDSPDGKWTGAWEKVLFRPVREMDGKVWLRHTAGLTFVDPYAGGEVVESLLYDFTADDSEPLTFYTPDGEQTRDIINGLTEVGGEELRSYTFEGSDGVKSVEGLGIVKGGILPCVNTEFRLPTSKDDDTYCGAVLVAVYDGEGKLIYSQEMPEAIGEIPGSEDGWLTPDQRIFDLQGRELAEPVPGQPYIRGGKVLVEAK